MRNDQEKNEIEYFKNNIVLFLTTDLSKKIWAIYQLYLKHCQAFRPYLDEFLSGNI